MRFRRKPVENTIQLDMTPMIDIVFQLLVFFIMSFKIITPEGDFNIKMPLKAPSEGAPDLNQLPPIKVRLAANPDGTLKSLHMNGQPLESFEVLHHRLLDLLGDERGPGSAADTAEVELDCDYNLRYEYTIAAITAVSGYITADNRVVKMVEKIKFAPPRTPPDRP